MPKPINWKQQDLENLNQFEAKAKHQIASLQPIFVCEII